MNRIPSTWRRLVLVGSLLLAACGGGSGGIDGSGAKKDTQSYGSITAFGSVWVNGVEFETGGATIRIDDNPHPESDLRLGMVARVEGSLDDRQAVLIEVDDALKGRVEQVIDAARMVVMGQTVLIDGNTRFGDSVVPVLGDWVEVHGLAVADGSLSAGYIERKAAPASPPFVVKGFVRNHDSAVQRFTIGGLTVDYRGAAVSDLGSGSWNGLQVTVKGSTCAGSPVCGSLAASKVEPAGARLSDAIGRAELEGFVTAVNTDGFVLGGQVVRTGASTVYEGGTLAEIVVGAKLEVEGSVSAGVLTASKVAWRDNVRIEADVAAVAGGGLSLTGLPGLTVQVNALTELKDIVPLASLVSGDHLRIKARPGPGATVLALEIEGRSADSRTELRAPVSGTDAATTLQLQGVAIDTSTVTEFRLQDGTSVGRSAFLAGLRVGTLVKARGTRSAGTVRWESLEREN